MRVGFNPLNKKRTLKPYGRHRIIVPVYIPNAEDYYRDSLQIFRMSLATLLATVDPLHTSITIIDNASVPEVASLVLEQLKLGKIDKYVRHETNRGKPDAVVSEIKGSYEELITVCDCDVLFLHGWQRAIEDIYYAFPGVGAVSPFPGVSLQGYANASTWLRGLFSGAIRMRGVVSGSDLDQFEISVGRAVIFDKKSRATQMLLKGRQDTLALLGGFHFVITLRRDVFDVFEYQPGLGGTSTGEREIDEHVDRLGALRLSTIKAYVKHMGNVPEEWMPGFVESVLNEEKIPCRIDPLPRADAFRRCMGYIPHVARRILCLPIRHIFLALRPR